MKSSKQTLVDNIVIDIRVVFEEEGAKPQKPPLVQGQNDGEKLSNKLGDNPHNELIENFLIPTECFSPTKPGCINFQKLIRCLELTTNISFQGNNSLISSGHHLSYFFEKHRVFIKCGNHPLKQNIFIRPGEYKNVKELTIVAKNRNVGLCFDIVMDDVKEWMVDKEEPVPVEFEVKTLEKRVWKKNLTSEKVTQEKEQVKEQRKMQADEKVVASKKKIPIKPKNGSTPVQNLGPRLNERRIGLVVNQVVEWCKLTGNYSLISEEEKHKSNEVLTLEEGSDKVKIPRKTLDDYFFHIHYAFKRGFNFNEHWTDKFAVLRSFVNRVKRDPRNRSKALAWSPRGPKVCQQKSKNKQAKAQNKKKQKQQQQQE